MNPADAGHTDETVQCPSLHTKKGSVNMKTSIKLCGLAAAVLMATAGSAMASDTVIPYVLDSQNKVVTNSTGLCWRTSFWTPALAEQGGPDGLGCTCDKDILSAAACTKAAPVEEPRVAKVTLAADTLFAFDSAKLSEDGRNMLDQLVSRMAGMDVEVILTTGYADRLVLYDDYVTLHGFSFLDGTTCKFLNAVQPCRKDLHVLIEFFFGYL